MQNPCNIDTTSDPGKTRVEAKLDTLLCLVHTLTQRLVSLESNCSEESIDRKIEDAVEKKVSEYLDEKQEKEKRKSNIVITNLPESKKESPGERKQDDLDRVKEIVQKVLPEVDGSMIENPVRLGQFKIGSNVRPRLVRVSVKTEEMKNKILRKAYKLNQGVTNKNEKIFINQDLTPKQREVEKALRDELRERRDNGEEDLVIRNGRIVQRTVRQMNESDKADQDAQASSE